MMVDIFTVQNIVVGDINVVVVTFLSFPPLLLLNSDSCEGSGRCAFTWLFPLFIQYHVKQIETLAAAAFFALLKNETFREQVT